MLDQIILGDSRQLASLVDGRQPSVDTIITSPPYGDLINYRMDSQLGFGQNWEQYLEDLTAILRKCYLILKDTGSLWLVVDAWHDRKTYRLFPMEIANKASAIGWKLRDIIIWDKQHTLPYYSHGQFRPIYEYILFFTKSDGYKFYRDRIREVDGLSMWWVDFPERFSPLGKSPTNIWHFPIRPQGGGWRGKREIWRHACPFPTELVAQIIELTTDKGDLVFDPFAGSGVVLATAAAMQRHYLGIELNPEFVDQFKSIVRDEVAKEYKQLLKKRKLMDGLNGSFGSMILRLRALKYARKVTEALNSHIHKSTLPRSASRTKLLLCVCIAAIPNSYERGEGTDHLCSKRSGKTPPEVPFRNIWNQSLNQVFQEKGRFEESLAS